MEFGIYPYDKIVTYNITNSISTTIIMNGRGEIKEANDVVKLK